MIIWYINYDININIDKIQNSRKISQIIYNFNY